MPPRTVRDVVLDLLPPTCGLQDPSVLRPRIEAVLSTYEERARAAEAEVLVLRQQIVGHAARIAAQADQLARNAERSIAESLVEQLTAALSLVMERLVDHHETDLAAIQARSALALAEQHIEGRKVGV